MEFHRNPRLTLETCFSLASLSAIHCKQSNLNVAYSSGIVENLQLNKIFEFLYARLALQTNEAINNEKNPKSKKHRRWWLADWQNRIDAIKRQVWRKKIEWKLALVLKHINDKWVRDQTNVRTNTNTYTQTEIGITFIWQHPDYDYMCFHMCLCISVLFYANWNFSHMRVSCFCVSISPKKANRKKKAHFCFVKNEKKI